MVGEIVAAYGDVKCSHKLFCYLVVPAPLLITEPVQQINAMFV